MIIDSHCHLDFEPLFNNLEQVIKRANNNGVKYFLTISTTDESFKNILNIIKDHKNIFEAIYIDELHTWYSVLLYLFQKNLNHIYLLKFYETLYFELISQYLRLKHHDKIFQSLFVL